MKAARTTMMRRDAILPVVTSLAAKARMGGRAHLIFLFSASNGDWEKKESRFTFHIQRRIDVLPRPRVLPHSLLWLYPRDKQVLQATREDLGGGAQHNGHLPSYRAT